MWQEMADIVMDEGLGLSFPATWISRDKNGNVIAERPVQLLPGAIDDTSAFPRARIRKDTRVVKMDKPDGWKPVRDDRCDIDGIEWWMRETPGENARGTRLIIKLVR